MKPFLKWAGNKYRIIDRIQALLPNGKRLIEPFVGSGALFLNTDYPAYLLADANRDLIELYVQLQQGGTDFVDYCRTFFKPENNASETFYAFRTEFNTTDDPHHKSALFLYLNKHCFNGLCRYNQKGEYNVPFGRYTKPYFPETEMTYFYEQAQRATFYHADFTQIMAMAQKGDVVYCDPPYVPLSSTANFTTYSAGGFDGDAQQRLADRAEALVAQHIPVIISNHDTEFTRQIYAKAALHAFEVQRFISAKGDKREKASELLAFFNPGDSKKTVMQQGKLANRSGNTLERTIMATMESNGFQVEMYRKWQKHPERYSSEILLRNVPYTTIYGHRGNTEFLLLSEHYKLEIRIECKWQQSAGSVDEKYPYLYLNCVEQMPEREIIIVVDGGGAKPGAIEWLKQASEQGLYTQDKQKSIQVMSLTEFLTWTNNTFR